MQSNLTIYVQTGDVKVEHIQPGILQVNGNSAYWVYDAVKKHNASEEAHPYFHGVLAGKQDVSNLVTQISSASTDTQYPSAKCMYDIVGNIEALLSEV